MTELRAQCSPSSVNPPSVAERIIFASKILS